MVLLWQHNLLHSWRTNSGVWLNLFSWNSSLLVYSKMGNNKTKKQCSTWKKIYFWLEVMEQPTFLWNIAIITSYEIPSIEGLMVAFQRPFWLQCFWLLFFFFACVFGAQILYVSYKRASLSGCLSIVRLAITPSHTYITIKVFHWHQIHLCTSVAKPCLLLL